MSELQKRLDMYINSENACGIAVTLIAELRGHLRLANNGAEANLKVALAFLDKYHAASKSGKLEAGISGKEVV